MVGLGIFLLLRLLHAEPNEARVLILFGAYKGTVRQQRLPLGESALRAQPRHGAGLGARAEAVKIGPLSMQTARRRSRS